MRYTVKTFGECTYGRHALTEPGGPGDIRNLANIHPTRLAASYQPRHAAIDDEKAVMLIRRELHGGQSHADTLDVIAAYVRATGR